MQQRRARIAGDELKVKELKEIRVSEDHLILIKYIIVDAERGHHARVFVIENTRVFFNALQSRLDLRTEGWIARGDKVICSSNCRGHGNTIDRRKIGKAPVIA